MTEQNSCQQHFSSEQPEHLPDSADPSEQAQTPIIPEIVDDSVRRVRIYTPAVKPIVTYALMVLTIAVYMFQTISKQTTGTDLGIAFGAKYGPLIAAGQFWRLITPILLHGSLMHIAFNMYALMVVGRDLEPAWGHFNFLIYYLITGFGGNVFSTIFSPNSISVGASTSLFGLIAAQGALIYRNRKFFRNYRNAISNILFIILFNLTIGMRSGIDNWGHLGGLVSGAMLAFLSTPLMDVTFNPAKARYELTDTVPQSKRNIAFLLVFGFFAALIIAFLSRARFTRL
jgi:rhomboid protease GluP